MVVTFPGLDKVQTLTLFWTPSQIAWLKIYRLISWVRPVVLLPSKGWIGKAGPDCTFSHYISNCKHSEKYRIPLSIIEQLNQAIVYLQLELKKGNFGKYKKNTRTPSKMKILAHVKSLCYVFCFVFQNEVVTEFPFSHYK